MEKTKGTKAASEGASTALVGIFATFRNGD